MTCPFPLRSKPTARPSARNGTHVHWPQKREFGELHDISDDPYEIRNLLPRPGYDRQARELKSSLLALIPESLSLII